MKLAVLLEGLEYRVDKGSQEIEVTELFYDSRKQPMPGSVFVCIAGGVYDGHKFINEVVTKGVAAVIVSREITAPEGLTVIRVPDTRVALAEMSAAYFGHPAKRLVVIGITGTKGKTTTAYMVYSILNKAGIKTGLIGTIETRIGDTVISSLNTTPESFVLQDYFRKMADAGLACIVMEASSQGFKQNRIAGFHFDYGVFTNIEPDHIGQGEHEDFNDYLQCKKMLFQRCRTGIFNIDDSHIEEILEGHTCTVETFGTKEGADFCATSIDLHSSMGSMGVSYEVKGNVNFRVQVDVPGSFSVYNSLTAIAICSHFNVPEETIKEALLKVKVKGRVETVTISKRFTLMLDYAHNAMSLKSLLSTLKEYEPKRLVCLFGCGGNRSKDRRFEMGEISSSLADFTIVTSDNPRFEEPEDILNDIVVGVKRGGGAYLAIIDRKEAIRHSIRTAMDGDVIVLAGKGHESYQEIKGKKYPMDERVLIHEIVAEMTEEERRAEGIFFPEEV